MEKAVGKSKNGVTEGQALFRSRVEKAASVSFPTCPVDKGARGILFPDACVLSDPLSTEASLPIRLSTLEHHSDIEVTLFAQEPMVIDPVALAFAAPGEAYVVEMRDYPYGIGPDRRPGGRIRLLRDTNADGVADEDHIFANNLRFPTSVAIWREGILVAVTPKFSIWKTATVTTSPTFVR